MSNLKGFGKTPVKEWRTFWLELKRREGEEEETIGWDRLQVPRLKNSRLEQDMMILKVWELMYSEEFIGRGINQIFVLSADKSETLFRLESQPFDDEPAHQLSSEFAGHIVRNLKKRLPTLGAKK